MMTLIARFQVDGYEPRQVTGFDADWFGLMTFAKTFTAGITGHATTLFMAAGSQEGSRSYVATERITGRLDGGEEGSVTVQHGGLESEPGTWFGHIVPNTGTGGFAGWSGPAGWDRLAREPKVQGSALVPSMIQMLLSQRLEDADLSNLVAISSGAAPLADDVRREFETRVPTATVYEGYGCTEAATFISANPWGARRLGSVGRPVPGVELTIPADAGQPPAAGQDGEICVRSPGVMTGYWHSEDTSALAGGWLHTGDIGHVDQDGYLYVVDRKKDLILRGGFNVFPRDIEDVLLSHPAVAQAGVVGRPDARLGEEVVAFVSLRPGAEATAEELTEHAKRHLAANKYPREITIVPMVPLTSVGKLDRKKLREWVRG